MRKMTATTIAAANASGTMTTTITMTTTTTANLPRKRGSQGGGIGDYFSFKKLMIADAIPIVFWVGVVLILGYAGWLMSLSSTLNRNDRPGNYIHIHGSRVVESCM